MNSRMTVALVALLAAGCGTLEKKTILINPGDDKAEVIKVMGSPVDRQFQASREAWQYCVSGAGFGWNDHRVIWFTEGHVTAITSYRSSGPGCVGLLQQIRWEQAPDQTIEIRNR